jgi:glutaredoxin-like protein NrdH
MKITVYRKPNCVKCNATERWLDRRHIPYEEIDVTNDPEALAAIKAMGYQTAPVVCVSDEEHLREDVTWCDVRPDLLEAVCGQLEGIAK